MAITGITYGRKICSRCGMAKSNCLCLITVFLFQLFVWVLRTRGSSVVLLFPPFLCRPASKLGLTRFLIQISGVFLAAFFLWLATSCFFPKLYFSGPDPIFPLADDSVEHQRLLHSHFGRTQRSSLSSRRCLLLVAGSNLACFEQTLHSLLIPVQ